MKQNQDFVFFEYLWDVILIESLSQSDNYFLQYRGVCRAVLCSW